MRITISEVDTLAEVAMSHGLRLMFAEMGLAVDAPSLPFALSARPVNTPAEVPAAGPVPPAGASAPGADGIHTGDLCLKCSRHQLPYWRESGKSTARACQNCGAVEERPAARVGCEA
ncbi:MAG: hypothetical protein JWN34_6062 [Bryobacterales bacterium]|nr:hypothetical protein [Bryobacterales bacterium]